MVLRITNLRASVLTGLVALLWTIMTLALWAQAGISPLWHMAAFVGAYIAAMIGVRRDGLPRSGWRWPLALCSIVMGLSWIGGAGIAFVMWNTRKRALALPGLTLVPAERFADLAWYNGTIEHENVHHVQRRRLGGLGLTFFAVWLVAWGCVRLEAEAYLTNIDNAWEKARARVDVTGDWATSPAGRDHRNQLFNHYAKTIHDRYLQVLVFLSFEDAQRGLDLAHRRAA